MLKAKGITAKFITITSLLTIILVTVLSLSIMSSARNSQIKQADVFSVSLKDEQVRQAELLKQNVSKKGATLLTLLSRTAAGLIAGYDFDTLKFLAESVSQDQDIRFVTFYDAEDKALTDEISDRGNLQILKHDIVYDDEKVGTVEIGLDLSGVQGVITAITKRIDEVARNAEETMAASQHALIWRVVAFTVIGVVLLCLAIYFSLKRLITRPVNGIVEHLTGGAAIVSTASEQISTSSHTLASGATEQAASIEETSASLEEMAAMTKQNADNSHQAETLMTEANKVIAKANQTMNDMTDSMGRISKTSEETQKIVKTIDEIAFQTNLLALNAAVEAARAGEAGAGFAVVADEVRNLAMRAADAAKNTSTLIDGSVVEIKHGSELVNETNSAFDEVSESADKVTQLIGEIATASNEQAQGISQINSAVSEMDRVVQQNASTAEESASAAQEMNSEAGRMKGMVNDLVVLIEGKKKGQSETAGAKEETGERAFTSRNEISSSGDTAARILPIEDDDTFSDF